MLEHGIGAPFPRVVLTGPWDGAVAQYMRQEGVASLVVNYARGFVGEDLAFLSEVPHLKSLAVFHPHIGDFAPLYRLAELEELDVGTRLPHSIDFARFPALRALRCQWRKGCESIFEMPRLERLNLASYPGADLSNFTLLPQLRRLSLLRGKLTTIDGVSALRELRELRLLLIPTLSTLAGAETVSLEALHVETCMRVDNIAPLASATKIRRLTIANCKDVESLTPVETMTSLEHLNASESTTIVDGDLSPLLRAPKLRGLQLQSRKNYRPPVPEVEREIERRHFAWLRAQGKLAGD